MSRRPSFLSLSFFSYLPISFFAIVFFTMTSSFFLYHLFHLGTNYFELWTFGNLESAEPNPASFDSNGVRFSGRESESGNYSLSYLLRLRNSVNVSVENGYLYTCGIWRGKIGTTTIFGPNFEFGPA